MTTPNIEIVEKAYAQEWRFRDATQTELLSFKKKLRKYNKDSELSLEAVKQKLLDKLKKDLTLIKALNEALKNFPPSAEITSHTSTWALNSNKMVEILEGVNGAIDLAENHFEELITSIQTSEELPGYKIKTTKPEVTQVGVETDTIYGTSKGSVLKTVLINLALIYSGKDYLSEIKPNENWIETLISYLKKCFGIPSKQWIDKTPNAQVTPLPQDLDPKSIKVGEYNFTKCTYYYQDAKTAKGLAYIHSGYAFGAYRNDPRYPYPPGKPFGPEDCSSWIGKLTLETDAISTADLWNRWKYQREGYTINDPNWVNTPTAKKLIERFEPMEMTDPIVPGLVWATRNFDTTADPEKTGNGKGGHTVLIVKEGTTKNKEGEEQVEGMGYNRNMPDIEGFGVSNFPVKDTADKRIMFFKVKPESERQIPDTSNTLRASPSH